MAAWAMVLAVSAALIPRASAQSTTKDDLQRQIETYEQTLSKIKGSENIPPLQTGRIWLHLGRLYEDRGLYEESEKAFEEAIRMFRDPPVSARDLAAAMDGLGTVYLQRGNVSEAERAELKALEIREKSGDKQDLAKSWRHLACLYLRQHRTREAREYAARAVHELLAEPEASAEDQISALFTLSLSLDWLHEYARAIETLQDALHRARRVYRPDDFPVGFGTFLLGYSYWKAGEIGPASEMMQQGTETMGRQLG